MTSQIMPPYYSTTRVRKCITGKPRTASQIKHEKFIQSVTKGAKSSKQIKQEQFLRDYKENMKVDQTRFKSEGGFGISSSCSKKGVMTNLFKETPEVQKEILAKAARIAPLFNKGGLQYITDDQDKTDLGRKK